MGNVWRTQSGIWHWAVFKASVSNLLSENDFLSILPPKNETHGSSEYLTQILSSIDTTSAVSKRQFYIMFAHTKLLLTFSFLFAAATVLLSQAIPSPNVHSAATQVDEYEHPPILLESRAPLAGADRPPFSRRELGAIFDLCKEITKHHRRNYDLFFVEDSRM